MNAAIFRYTAAVTGLLVLFTTTVSSQNINDGSFGPDGGEFDYQDFQLAPRPTPAQAVLPQRSAARPRSPAIASATGQSKITPTPVAILKQINRHNEDGSYTYGFEGGDGSFKIETKLATGEVIGKYGYVDDSGKVRTVEYGANKYGFQPAGEGITIPPVTIGNDTEDASNNDAPSPGDDQGQSFLQIPVRPAKPPPAPKRRPAKPPQQPVLIDQRVPRPQPPPPQQPYFVREPEDVQIRPQPQRPPTPTDINSLQLLLGNQLADVPQFQFRANENAPQREVPQFQFRSNEIPPQRGFQAVVPEETQEEPVPRPFPQSLTIPSVFDQQPQFAQAQAPTPVDFNQQFDVPGAPRVPAGAFRAAARSQPKPKSRPPPVLFISQPEDIQQPVPAAVRRNSNLGPETRSILDELLKQYAIPNASPAINDFSFSQNGQ